jgi:anti-sigma regulatory factor (Ser/Thr protein kinase)
MARADSVCDPAAPAQMAYPAACAAQWPHQSVLELGALPSAVPCIRLHTTLILREWGMIALAEAAELVAAELATNAIQAAESTPPGRPAAQEPTGLAVVSLHLASDQQHVLVEVGDDDPRPPDPAPADPERDSGRGLLLVEAVSARWGCYYLNPEFPQAGPTPAPALARPGAKVVWALIKP